MAYKTTVFAMRNEKLCKTLTARQLHRCRFLYKLQNFYDLVSVCQKSRSHALNGAWLRCPEV
ncbi:hypothetical protein [Prevotella nigrescens]|uniref:hypothetical protein n=1 Tax=Prevotella nigrescens TaxID=28133 RepID=UPI000345F797|nr:hypothetical protein [Prevotella nigrescens]